MRSCTSDLLRLHCALPKEQDTSSRHKGSRWAAEQQNQSFRAAGCCTGLPHCSCTSLCLGLPRSRGGRQGPGATLSVRTGKLSEHCRRTQDQSSATLCCDQRSVNLLVPTQLSHPLLWSQLSHPLAQPPPFKVSHSYRTAQEIVFYTHHLMEIYMNIKGEEMLSNMLVQMQLIEFLH